jgi:hypothetical protein
MVRIMVSFHGEGLSTPRLTPRIEDHPLVGCPRLIIQYIRNYPPSWRLFLHLQLEDAPCRGDRDSLITDLTSLT